MKFKYRLLACTLFLFLGSCSKDEPREPESPDPDEILVAQMQQLIDSKIGGSDKLIGVTVSIRIGFDKEYKLSGGVSAMDQPMPIDAKFGIASITKTVVGATILSLEEDGLLSLEDPIGDYLDLENANIDPAITINQLLNHFAGLRDHFEDPAIWPDVESDLQQAIAPTALANYIGEPVFAPGTSYEYSNANFVVLGLVIEAVTGKTVGEVMREQLWEPLGLDGIYFAANETVPPPIAAPWRDMDGDGTLEDITDQFGPAYHSVFYTAADVFSTASSLSLWAQHLFNGNALSPVSRTKMLDFYAIGDPVFTGYGLGVREIFFPDRTLWGHTGGMRGYGTFMFYDPTTQVSIAVLNNQSRSVNGPVLRAELYRDLLLLVFDSLD